MFALDADVGLGDAAALELVADQVADDDRSSLAGVLAVGRRMTDTPPCRSRPSDGRVAEGEVERAGAPNARRTMTDAARPSDGSFALHRVVGRRRRRRRRGRSACCASESSMARRAAASADAVSTLPWTAAAGDPDLHVVVDLEPDRVVLERR